MLRGLNSISSLKAIFYGNRSEKICDAMACQTVCFQYFARKILKAKEFFALFL